MSNPVLERTEQILLRGWTQGTLARRGRDRVSPESNLATCFCLVGAMCRAEHELRKEGKWERPLWDAALDSVCGILEKRGYPRNGGSCIAKFNDEPERTAEEVIALVREANS